MPEFQYSSLSSALLFSRTFVPGGTVFPTPRYFFLDEDEGIVYTRQQTLASTSHFNINPQVTLTGSNLSTDSSGNLSGTVTGLKFSSDNRGTILTVTGLAASGSAFIDVISARLNGDRSSNDLFDSFLGRAFGSFTLNDGADTLRTQGFVSYLDAIDLAGGDDTFTMFAPEQPVFRIDGGAGNDTLIAGGFGQSLPYVVNLAMGTITAEDRTVFFTGFETIEGGIFVQEYIGSDGADVIRAAGRDDLISGGVGNDSLSGEAGNDSIMGGIGFDTIEGGSGNDTLLGGSGADSLNGDSGDDLIIGGRGFDNINGGDGNDTIRAGDTADRVFGGGGNDLIEGGTNIGRTVDRLFGQDGNDTILGEAGFDVLDGGAGDDHLDGGDLADNVFGRSGDDTLLGGNGLDRLFGGDGADEARGGAGRDGLFGGLGNDLLFGDDGNDRFFGGPGNDTLEGGLENDTIFAGAGFDVITGGSGDDLLFGNFNADTFVFADGHGTDVIADFAADNALERVDLSAVSQIFNLFDLFSGHLSQDGENVVIDTGIAQQITLLGVDLTDLDATDFIF